jgi:GMP synthase (glutamine-hydrolysing)
VMLSGGHNFTIIGHEDLLQDEIKLIKTFKGPILGICFGFELIAHTFGAKMKELPGKENGVISINVIEKDEIFIGLDDFEVFENHRWVVDKLSDNLLALAESKDGFESIKHKDMPIYGVQFHPEMFVANKDGEKIFHNFVELVS